MSVDDLIGVFFSFAFEKFGLSTTVTKVVSGFNWGNLLSLNPVNVVSFRTLHSITCISQSNSDLLSDYILVLLDVRKGDIC